MPENRKFAGYICTGCGIGDRLDIAQLELVATQEGNMQICRTHEMLCSREGVQSIRNDIEDETITHVMIAACSRRAKVEAFNIPAVALSRANLREGVIWVRPDTPEHQETTQEMADDYLRMACAELEQMKRPSASGEQELNKQILVVGGGITGMTSALETSKAGYPVHIVEKSDSLGGHATNYYQSIPVRFPYDAPVATGVEQLITEVTAAESIRVHLSSSIAKISGAPGRFATEILDGTGSMSTVTFGAIIQATGFKLFDPTPLARYNYANSADIITNEELEKLAKGTAGGPIKRPSDGKAVETVAFLQNVGQCSSEKGALAYHSGIGDLVSIKQALYFKELNPNCDTTIIYNNLRTPGSNGEGFYRASQAKMVTFSKGDVRDVVPGETLEVKFKDLILNEETSVHVDLVVLDVGMMPNSGPAPHTADLEDEQSEREDDRIDTTSVTVSVDSILNLDYRQGSDLPHLKYGFTDSNFVCFPYETRRTGIYAAGPLRRPMDMQQARDDAAGAAMKAMQAAENAGKGMSVHPRAGDLSYPKFRKAGCTQCKRCTLECPFGAINEDEVGYPQFNEARCRRCGTCMGACPVRVISFENYSIDTVGKQLEKVDMPDEFSGKPRILVLACENDAYPALDQAAMMGIEITPWARVVPVRCLGSTNASWITESLNNGYDGIVMMGCKKGVDYQCHYVRGTALADERMSRIGDTLESLNLEPERVVVHEVAITDIRRAPQLINEMSETVAKIGMNPFKF